MTGADFKDAFLPLVKPLAFAAGSIAIGLFLFGIEVPEEEKMRAVGLAGGGFVFFAIAAGILLVPVFRFGSSIIEGIFWPTDSYTPPALYKLAEWLTKEGRFADAMAEYEKIDSNHPGQLATYLGILEVQIIYMGDANSALHTLQRGLKKLKKPVQQQMLQQHYDTLWQQAQEQVVAPPAEQTPAEIEAWSELSHEEENIVQDEQWQAPVEEGWEQPAEDTDTPRQQQ